MAVGFSKLYKCLFYSLELLILLFNIKIYQYICSASNTLQRLAHQIPGRRAIAKLFILTL